MEEKHRNPDRKWELRSMRNGVNVCCNAAERGWKRERRKRLIAIGVAAVLIAGGVSAGAIALSNRFASGSDRKVVSQATALEVGPGDDAFLRPYSLFYLLVKN